MAENIAANAPANAAAGVEQELADELKQLEVQADQKIDQKVGYIGSMNALDITRRAAALNLFQQGAKLSTVNYLQWEMETTGKLMVFQLNKVVTMSVEERVEARVQEAAANKKAEVRIAARRLEEDHEELVRTLLHTSVSASLQPIVRDRKLNMVTVWSRLQAGTSVVNDLALVQLRKDLLSTQFSKEGEVRNGIDVMLEQREKLRAAGLEVSDTDFNATLIGSRWRSSDKG